MRGITVLRRNRNAQDDRGSLVLSLLVVMVVGGLVAVLISTVLAGSLTTRHNEKFTQVLPAADAGVQRALFLLNNRQPMPSGTVTDVQGGKTVTWSATQPAGQPLVWNVTSSSEHLGVRRTVRAEILQDLLFPVAAFGDTSINLRGGNRISSYNSTTQTNNTGNGVVASNGSVKLNGSTSTQPSADGVRLYNWEADPNPARCSGWPCGTGAETRVDERLDVSSGTSTDFIRAQLARCTQPLAAWRASTSGATLGAGVQCYSSMNFDVATTVSGTPSNPTVVYVQGNITGGAHINVNYDAVTKPLPPATAFRLFSVGSLFDMSNHSTWGAAVYAPLATCKAGAQSHVWGSLVCGKLDSNGGWNLHYDDALTSIGNGAWRMRRYAEGS